MIFTLAGVGLAGRALLRNWLEETSQLTPAAPSLQERIPGSTPSALAAGAQRRSGSTALDLTAGRAGAIDAAVVAAFAPTRPADATALAAAASHDAGVADGEADAMQAVQVQFEHRGGAMLVPVVLAGPELRFEAKLLFDTGASLTTIDHATLGRLGLYVTAADPTVTVQTANGRVARTISVIDGLAVGAARVTGGLTVAICDACAQGDMVGLLGTNFTRHFRVAIDHEAGLLVLSPRPAPADRLDDIRPFISLTDVKGVQRGEALAVKLTVRNRSPRELRGVRVRAEPDGRAEGAFAGTVNVVPPRGEAALELVGSLVAPISHFEMHVDAATW
ncbi:MAG: clan AA aspartic protease [Proteobacteria bacterium]|nr:clan AA aspartic protease [Pseudomonadota bacterium]